MYVITSNGTTSTAETIPEALTVFAGQLQTSLLAGGVRWTITDPDGTNHQGHINLNGRHDLLHSSISELCDDLYPSSTAQPTATAASNHSYLTTAGCPRAVRRLRHNVLML